MEALLILKARDEYPDRILDFFSTNPSPEMSHTVVRSHNLVLSLHQLASNPDKCMLLDRQALSDTCFPPWTLQLRICMFMADTLKAAGLFHDVFKPFNWCTAPLNSVPGADSCDQLVDDGGDATLPLRLFGKSPARLPLEGVLLGCFSKTVGADAEGNVFQG